MAAKVGQSMAESFTDIAEEAAKMSIVELTSQPAVRERTEEKLEKSRMKYIDLRHQLILWKKTDFMLDNIAFTSDFCDALVSENLFNVDMMSEVMSHHYDVEKTLKMLALLGTHGDGVYDNFLKALNNTKHYTVVKELKKAERFTKYGEQLPAVFHYFLNLSEFLRKYPHIAVKLGEDEKHLLNSFIEGHIDIGIRKNREKVIKMESKILKLKEQVRQMRAEIKVRAAHELELEMALRKANAHIEEYRNRVKVAEDISMENRNEARKLRHFRAQQEELVKFIAAKGEELKMPDFGPRELTRQLSTMRNLLERQKTQVSKLMLQHQVTDAGQKRKVSVGQNSRMGSRQNTKLGAFQSNNPETVLASLRMSQTQLNLLANKVYYMQVSIQSYDKEENRLKILLDQEGHDKTYRNDMKKLLADVKREKKLLKDQLVILERELYQKEAEVMMMRKETMGVGTTPADVQFYKTQHDSLISQMTNLLKHIKFLHGEDMKEEERRREKIITDYIEHIKDLKNKHIEECGKLKLKIRTKIAEINDREKVLNRLKKQINTMVNYHSKNMNATIPVEECRKITRSMIGEARKLKAIADEKDREKAELERLEAIGDPDKIREFHEKKAKKEEKKKKLLDKRKFKKKPSYMADDRLRYIADRLCLEWRVLGKCLGLTNNRMDMIEWDCPANFKQDLICFAMLKAWRDEEKGKIIELVEALRQMDKSDLAVIVMPLDRMHLLDKKKKKGEDDEEDDLEDDDEDDEEDGEDGEEDDLVGEMNDDVALEDVGTDGGYNTDSSEAKSQVPKLPAIKGAAGGGKKPKQSKGKGKKKK